MLCDSPKMVQECYRSYLISYLLRACCQVLRRAIKKSAASAKLTDAAQEVFRIVLRVNVLYMCVCLRVRSYTGVVLFIYVLALVCI